MTTETPMRLDVAVPYPLPGDAPAPERGVRAAPALMERDP